MEISHRVLDNICVFTVGEDLTAHIIPDAQNLINSVIDDESIRGIILDVEKIEFIGSSGLGMMIALVKRLENRGGFVALCNVSINLQKAIMTAGLGVLLHLHETEEDAINSLKELMD